MARRLFCPKSGDLHNKTYVTTSNIILWSCIHRCLSTSICRYVCVTSCHAFASVRFDSMPELLPCASLQLRVESSTCVSFFIHVHVGLCTSCHALESIRSDSIPELLLGAPLPLRVEVLQITSEGPPVDSLTQSATGQMTAGVYTHIALSFYLLLHINIHRHRHMLRHCYGLRLMETVRILRNEAPVSLSGWHHTDSYC